MLETADLLAFARIAELGSVSGAARSMGRPKSSVSRSLARLEAELGAGLVERSTRNVKLTDAGRLLHSHAERILGELDEAEAALGGFTGVPRGVLRVNAPYSFAMGAIAPMLPGFLQRYRELEVVLEMQGASDPPSSDADLIIRLGPLPDSSMIARRLATVELWTCANAAYLSGRGVPRTVKDLPAHDIVGATRKLQWSYRTHDGRVEGIELRARAVVPDAALTRLVLARGGGIGRLPDFMAGEAIAAGELQRVLEGFSPETIDAHAIFPPQRTLSAKVRVFLDLLVAQTESRRVPFENDGGHS